MFAARECFKLCFFLETLGRKNYLNSWVSLSTLCTGLPYGGEVVEDMYSIIVYIEYSGQYHCVPWVQWTLVLLCTGLPYSGEADDMYSSDYSATYSEKEEEKANTNKPRLAEGWFDSRLCRSKAVKIVVFNTLNIIKQKIGKKYVILYFFVAHSNFSKAWKYVQLFEIFCWMPLTILNLKNINVYNYIDCMNNVYAEWRCPVQITKYSIILICILTYGRAVLYK